MLIHVMSVGEPRELNITGPIYVSCGTTGQVLPSTYPHTRVKGCTPGVIVPIGSTAASNSHMEIESGAAPETVEIVPLGWMFNTGMGWTNCGIALFGSGSCGDCAARARPAGRATTNDNSTA